MLNLNTRTLTTVIDQRSLASNQLGLKPGVRDACNVVSSCAFSHKSLRFPVHIQMVIIIDPVFSPSCSFYLKNSAPIQDTVPPSARAEILDT